MGKKTFTEKLVVDKNRGILGTLDQVEDDEELDSECMIFTLKLEIDESWFDGPVVTAVMDATPEPVSIEVEPSSRIEL